MRDSASSRRDARGPSVRSGVQLLYRLLVQRRCRPAQAAFHAWCEQSPYAALAGASQAAVAFRRAYGFPAGEEDLPRAVFALHTWLALSAKLVIGEKLGPSRGSPSLATPRATTAWAKLLAEWDEGHFLGWHVQGAFEPGLFGWPVACWTPALAEMVQGLAQAVVRGWPLGPTRRAPQSKSTWQEDPLGRFYQALVPRPVRHTLGEYYTPVWLVRLVLDAAGYPALGPRLMDPTCGSGAFVIEAIGRLRAGEGPISCSGGPLRGRFTWQRILTAVAGMDANPLAVVLARLNCLVALADELPGQGRVTLPVMLGDAVFQKASLAEQYDYVVGNPPWIAWDNLPEPYRRAAHPLWQHYGLFSLSARQARHGGAKKDLAMLVAYLAADRYLRPGGRLAMLVPQSVFQTRGAGDGFRRFRLGQEGQPLAVVEVHDLAALRPFDAENRPAALVLDKGRRTTYPVPYVQWMRRPNGITPSAVQSLVASQGCGRVSDTPQAPDGPDSSDRSGSANQDELAPRLLLEAWPIDPHKPRSPWVLWPGAWSRQGKGHPLEELVGPSEYQAYLGANTGGANGVYWMMVLEAEPGENGPKAVPPRAQPAGRQRRPLARRQALPETVRVCNLARCGRRAVPATEQRIEAELLFPLLRWGDIERFRARAGAYILLVQDAQRRCGIDEQILRTRYPCAYAYLTRFRGCLESRAAYRRYQARGPFYAMYDVGPYTLAPFKVVWRRMDWQFRAAVVGPQDHPVLGWRPVIPQETCALVPTRSAEEAHYLCALLNSAVVRFLAQAHSVQGGKGFASPGVLEYLNLRRFDRQRADHRALAVLSRQAHAQVAQGRLEGRIVAEIDRLAGRLYGLDAHEVARMAQACRARPPRS